MKYFLTKIKLAYCIFIQFIHDMRNPDFTNLLDINQKEKEIN